MSRAAAPRSASRRRRRRRCPPAMPVSELAAESSLVVGRRRSAIAISRVARQRHGVRQQHPRQHPEAGADPSAGRGRHARSAPRRSPRRTPTAWCSSPRRRRRCWFATTSTTRGSGASRLSGEVPVEGRPDAERNLHLPSTHATPRPTCRRTSRAARRRRSSTCWRPLRADRAAGGGCSRTCASRPTSRTCRRSISATAAPARIARARASAASSSTAPRPAAGCRPGPTACVGTADDVLTSTGENARADPEPRAGYGQQRAAVHAGGRLCHAGRARRHRLGRHQVFVRPREPDRRELPRHQLGHGCARRRRERSLRLRF